MRRYFFITPEGLTNKHIMDRPEPDFIEMQLFGYTPNQDIHDTINVLMELNDNIVHDCPEKVFSLELKDTENPLLRRRDYRAKSLQAG